MLQRRQEQEQEQLRRQEQQVRPQEPERALAQEPGLGPERGPVQEAWLAGRKRSGQQRRTGRRAGQ